MMNKKLILTAVFFGVLFTIPNLACRPTADVNALGTFVMRAVTDLASAPAGQHICLEYCILEDGSHYFNSAVRQTEDDAKSYLRRSGNWQLCPKSSEVIICAEVKK